ncbi:olfactory receptor 1J2-like [Phacochoerus africanus]|uniref:olfactory receptor 1J2-like n=1 Tax=Phacochoerus africanus TaxID=41426 RepID=UPI001FDAA115|nr:olfactory receptor 1J2-like [Phacochoerus africanus]
MRRENQSSMSEFFLLRLPNRQEQWGMFFALFLGMYLTTVLGNLLMILLVRLDPGLHTPMYFFLCHLDLTQVSYSSVTLSKMLMNLRTQDESINYAECLTQMYFFLLFACIDNLLAVMAYDSYVAIYHPPCYAIIMREELCLCFSAGSWLPSWVSALTHTLLLARQSFCADNIISHFCDLASLLNLSCSDASLLSWSYSL